VSKDVFSRPARESDLAGEARPLIVADGGACATAACLAPIRAVRAHPLDP